jgi:uncharacterized membrane protein
MADALDHTLFALTAAAALGAGIVGGIFYAFSSFVMKALSRLPPAQGVAAMNAINIAVVTPSFMVAFVGTALACPLLVAGTWLSWPPVSATSVLLAALAYLVASFAPTLLVNQPMNRRLGAMPIDQAIAQWPRYVRRWNTWNHLRCVASLLASALFIAAILLR